MTLRPSVTALLFGRAGSVALPAKNVRKILGRPSLYYPLMAARASGIVGDIYVSTDSDDIFALARPFGIKEIQRPAELATNEALLEDAIAHAFKVVDITSERPADFYLILLCNAVTVLPDRIRQAADMLNQDPEADSVTTGSRWNMFSPVRARRLDPVAGLIVNYVPADMLSQVVTISCDRDKSEDCYFCDNSFTLVRREALARLRDNQGPFKWMGNRIRFIEQLPGGGDVDETWQVPVVEWWLQQHGFSETKVPYEGWTTAVHARSETNAR
jgi:hypothetical protein